jgi:hypothetical protein
MVGPIFLKIMENRSFLYGHTGNYCRYLDSAPNMVARLPSMPFWVGTRRYVRWSVALFDVALSGVALSGVALSGVAR